MLAAHLTREPEPNSRVRPAIPADVDALVMRCLTKDPAGRLTSTELRREIEGLLAKETASSFETLPPAVIANDAADPCGFAVVSSAHRRRWRRLALVAAGVVVAGGTVVALTSRDRRQRVPATPPVHGARLGPRSVAVLPFENSSSDKDNEYFADGVTNELISALARVRGLRVTSRSTSFAFKGSRLGVRTIGDSLGVQNVLEGSVRKAGNQLRIFTQLTRVTDDSAIWSQTYDRELRDVFKVQEELAQSILVELQKQWGVVRRVSADGAPSQLVRHTTKDKDAYDLYLRGHTLESSYPRGFHQGGIVFNQAIARDSTFAAAWAGLADSYCILANFGIRPAREVCPQTAEAARRAIALDSTLAEAHASLGFVNLFYYWDFDTAERELKQAIALDSTYTNAYLWLNHLAFARSDATSGVAYMRKAVALEPLSLILSARLGTALRRAGRLSEAEEQLRHTLDLDSTFQDARGQLSLVEVDQGRFNAAVVDAEHVGSPLGIAYAYARAGRRDNALRVTRELEARSRRGEWIYPIQWRPSMALSGMRMPRSHGSNGRMPHETPT